MSDKSTQPKITPGKKNKIVGAIIIAVVVIIILVVAIFVYRAVTADESAGGVGGVGGAGGTGETPLVIHSQTTSKTVCERDGGYWYDKTQQCLTAPPGPSRLCIDSGGYWYTIKNECLPERPSDQQLCQDSGGYWYGLMSSCLTEEPSAEQVCNDSGKYWYSLTNTCMNVAPPESQLCLDLGKYWDSRTEACYNTQPAQQTPQQICTSSGKYWDSQYSVCRSQPVQVVPPPPPPPTPTPPPPPPALTYRFYQGMDSPSGDMDYRGDLANNIPALQEICNSMPGCKGFNTYGWIKSILNPNLSQWAPDPNAGLYVNDPNFVPATPTPTPAPTPTPTPTPTPMVTQLPSNLAYNTSYAIMSPLTIDAEFREFLDVNHTTNPGAVQIFRDSVGSASWMPSTFWQFVKSPTGTGVGIFNTKYPGQYLGAVDTTLSVIAMKVSDTNGTVWTVNNDPSGAGTTFFNNRTGLYLAAKYNRTGEITPYLTYDPVNSTYASIMWKFL